MTGGDDLGKKLMHSNKVGSERALDKHGAIIVAGERTRGGSGCREPDCTVNGARRLKPKLTLTLTGCVP